MISSDLLEKLERTIGSVHSMEVLAEQGCTSEVRCMATGEGNYILKSASHEKYRPWLKEEARVLELLQDEKAPIPRYYGYFEEKGSDHILMSMEKGCTLTTALKTASSIEEKKNLIRSFGKFLKQFHERSPFESLRREGDWLQSQLEAARGYVDIGQSDGDRSLLESLIRNKPQFVDQTMIHGDCTAGNVLVVDGSVCMFIDVAGMTVGDPRYDESLAIRKLRNKPELVAAFYEGYTRYKVSEEEFRYFNDGLYEFF